MEKLLAASLTREVGSAQSKAVSEPLFSVSPSEFGRKKGPDDDPPDPPPNRKG